MDQLLQIVAQLRGPGGCPWDREQTHATLRPGLLEEAHEVLAAIDAHDHTNLREELGDLLLQSVFHAQLATEAGHFTFDDIARDISAKLIRRHPHVFATEQCHDSTAVLQRWEEIKRSEKGHTPASVLDTLPPGLPALLLAQKTQKKAARLGFDWPDVQPVFAKLHEEIAELRAPDCDPEDELGDLLFTVVNLARHLHLDAETALLRATRKFATRLRTVERLARERGIALENLPLAELDVLWEEAKCGSV